MQREMRGKLWTRTLRKAPVSKKQEELTSSFLEP